MKRVLAIFMAVIMLLTSIPLMGLDSIFTPKAEAASMKQTISSMSVGDTIEFGSYPQSDVTKSMGSVLTAAAPATSSWNSYNYYVDGKQSDFMKYYDLTYNGERYRGVYFTKYRPYSWNLSSSSSNTYQYDNDYYTSTIYWFKYEPLTWRILDPSTGYVICETLIDSQAFNNEYYTNGTKDPYGFTAHYSDKTYKHYANNWEYSTIRQWLNDTFYNTAFTSSERSQIPCTKLTTPAYSTFYSAYDVGETGDYIFLPTYQDMINTSYGFFSDYWNVDINRQAHASAYAKSQGVYVSGYTDSYGENTSSYRLRSAGDYPNFTTYVFNGGYVKNDDYTHYTYYGIRPALCFNPSSLGTPSGSTKYDKEVTINVSSSDSYDGFNKLSLSNFETKLVNFTVTTSDKTQNITNTSEVKIDITEAKRGGVKISKKYYQDYIIPKEVFEDIFNEGFSANLSVKMRSLSSNKAGYISTAFIKEDGKNVCYTDAVINKVNITKGNKYKVILSAAGLGSNVTYYISQDSGHFIPSTTGVFDGDLFSEFVPNKDVYAYAKSSNGTTVLTKLNFKIVKPAENKTLDDFLSSNSTNILGDAPSSLVGQTGNYFLEGMKMDLSAFKIPISVGIDGNTVNVAVGVTALSYEHETKDSSSTGTKWKKDGQWSNFVKDYKEYFEKDNSWATKKENAKAANNKAKELTEKYGKKTSVKKQAVDFNLDVVGYGVFEIVHDNKGTSLVHKEGSIAITGALSYEYCQNGFVGACPGYIYFGFGGSLTAAAKAAKGVADLAVPMQWEFSFTIEPEITAGAGIGWKNWASLGLYGKASAPIYIRPALINRTGQFKLDVKGKIGVEATAAFIFKTKKPLLDGEMNIINKTWTKTAVLKSPAKYLSNSSTYETEEQKMVTAVESVDRSYATETSKWLGAKSLIARKFYAKSRALDLSGMKFTTLQESVFYAPQTQVAVVGDKVLMTFVEDDTTRTANNRMRLMYTVFNPTTDSWSVPKPVSDSGRNDLYPYLVSDGTNTYLTWINSNTVYPDDLSNSVDVFKACEVYLATFDAVNEEFIDVTRITNDEKYDYCPSVAIDSNGEPVVYYATCTDNNTFGKNNTITKYTDSKTVIESGKYYILSMTANSDNTELTYIMDKNGDTSDASDVNAYTIKNGITTETDYETAISDVFYAKLGGEEKLFFSDRANIYYFNDAGEKTAILSSNTGISSAVHHIETNDGLTFLFTQSEGETSELYFVSQTDNGWSEPVKLTNEEKLINGLAVAYNDGKLYGCITTRDGDRTDLVGFSFSDFTDITLGSISISELGTNAGEDNKFTVAVTNNGTNKVDSITFTVSDTLGTNSEQTANVNIEPGAMQLVELIYSAPENYGKTTLTVTAEVSADKNTADNTASKEIGLPQLRLEEPIVKEYAEYFEITTYAENLSDIAAKNVSVTVKLGETSLVDPATFSELALLQREEISIILPKTSLTYDEDGLANVTIAATCEDSDDDVVAILQDNSKDENGQCAHIETEIRQEAGSCDTERDVETVCVSCGESLGVLHTLEKGEHTWNEGEITKAATCAETGVMTFTCTACNETKTETIEKDTNHKNIVTVSGTPATCTQTGLTEGKICETCNTIIEEQKTINKLDHSYTVLKDTVPSTCIELGHKVMKCANCEATTNVDLTEYGEHTPGAPATETTPQTCTVCEYVIKPALGHTCTPVTIPGTPATCAEKGLTEGTKCSDCGTIIKAQTEIPALEHKEEIIPGKAATCAEKGLSDGKKCSVCGEITLKQVETPTIGHEYTEVVTKPTCAEGGFTTRTCENCGHVVKDDETPAKEHTPSDWIVEKPAQIGVAGLEIKKCTSCGEKLEEREIPALKEEPTTEAPTTEAPTTEAPTTEAPTTEAPTTEAPTTEAPTTEAPTTEEPTTEPSYMLGDINGDGKVTATDARIILRISARLEKLEDQKVTIFAAADVNGDGKITSVDARKVLRVSAKLESFNA